MCKMFFKSFFVFFFHKDITHILFTKNFDKKNQSINIFEFLHKRIIIMSRIAKTQFNSMVICKIASISMTTSSVVTISSCIDFFTIILQPSASNLSDSISTFVNKVVKKFKLFIIESIFTQMNMKTTTKSISMFEHIKNIFPFIMNMIMKRRRM